MHARFPVCSVVCPVPLLVSREYRLIHPLSLSDGKQLYVERCCLTRMTEGPSAWAQEAADLVDTTQPVLQESLAEAGVSPISKRLFCVLAPLTVSCSSLRCVTASHADGLQSGPIAVPTPDTVTDTALEPGDVVIYNSLVVKSLVCETGPLSAWAARWHVRVTSTPLELLPLPQPPLPSPTASHVSAHSQPPTVVTEEQEQTSTASEVSPSHTHHSRTHPAAPRVLVRCMHGPGAGLEDETDWRAALSFVSSQ
eukprot:m.79743 g.79743  ORF g.79743 m.79743 type:complete len:253 (-) comp13292_c0_seq2:191-949(-)